MATKKKTRVRNAVDGKFAKKGDAKRRPSTTVTETVDDAVSLRCMRKAIRKAIMLINESYSIRARDLLNEALGKR